MTSSELPKRTPASITHNPGAIDLWENFVHEVPELIRRARFIRETAHNYRGFNVGVVAMAASVDGSIHAAREGANIKKSSSAKKICGETIAVKQAKKDGLERIIGLVVVGEPQMDDESGLVSPTLHCCGVCREWLETQANDDTLILTALPDRDAFQLQTLAELINLHDRAVKGEDPLQPRLFNHYRFKGWDRIVDRYKELRGDILPIQSPETRQIAVSAARIALTGHQP